ncbi:S8 family serine peptidase [Serinicoccus sediminis]|uniref:S8 family serine peptidase n=1 Tax=Serinicoccus sediminis TaxID=2306021 RepID=UPI00101FE961|nr:S8 family serine peptidase [Serinicoccus sediminis]
MSMHSPSSRRWWATLATGALLVPGAATLPASAEPLAAGPEEKIEAALDAALEDDGRSDVWVRFAARPDLEQFSSITDWDKRGQAVADALQASAADSQADLRQELDEAGVEYRSFWATNSIRVDAADLDLVTSMASEQGVEGIYAPMEIELPPLKVEEPQMAPAAVEWGVDDVNAPEVWNDLGIRGEGVVVATIDSGAQYDHPALVNSYRGNNGDGTFDHDYNWFDAAGTSPDAPADSDGHGTHVTGTMVGDDGGDNQVGVAPGATWIAANGCCPSDAALIASGEWMLEPTDLEGENPDVSKRPHIINNSWGTTAPSTAPFMEDIIEAWAASGQFGVFANGNSGPSCQSSGSPGSRIVAYSVGNYNINHTISGTSGRGAGQDGEIKPNISAPGSAVRSSVPGNGYAVYSGTSMASPHVAGAVALAWSGAPALVGDVEGTRNLLNGTAIDTEDLQCGGTAEDNNVFGEGRLDALELVTSSPIGDAGTLEGTVTDASSGDPLADASVVIEGATERELLTGEAGGYSATLSSGDYDLTMSKFGYATETASATVEPGGTTTVDAALEPVPSGTVTGTVTDGSGYGFPLYARVSAEGTPAAAYTDPETGEFSLDLPEGETFELTVQAQYPGYVSTTVEATAGGGPLDVSVPVDAATCTAPGYAYVVDGVTESFDEASAPEGWEVVDEAGTGEVWQFDDPGERGNLTGGEGGFAVVDSDFYGSGGSQDTYLVSPSVDMSDLSEPVVGFQQDFYALGADLADVELSTDGGETWTTVLSQDNSVRGPAEQVVQLPDAAGESDVRVAFHYHQASYAWWWQVDDVFLGNRACSPTGEGGYVVGNVYGEEDGEGVVGATVTNVDAPEESGTTMATPSDDNLDDGFYWLFSASPGTHPFEASARGFASTTQDVTVTASDAVRADFVLGSGFVVVDESEIEVYQPLGSTRNHRFWVNNTGSGAAEVTLTEQAGEFEILRVDGSTERMGASYEGDGGEVVTLDVETSLAAGTTGRFGSTGAADPVRVAADPWTPLGNYPRVAMDNRVVNLDGDWYTLGGTTGSAAFADVNRYDPAAMEWVEAAALPEAASAVTAGAVDGRIVVTGGWVDGGVSSATHTYDPGTDSWSSAAEAPEARSAAGTAVLDGMLYSVGGCTTAECTPMSDTVMAYDAADDSWQQLADYPVAAAFVVCGGVDGQVLCSGGNPGSGGIADTYAYDPGSDSWTELPDAPADHWAAQASGADGQLVVNGGVQGGAVTNASFALDGASGEWSEIPASSAAVYRGGMACGIAKVGGSTGGFTPIDVAEQLPGYDDCGSSAADVDWLTVEPMEFTLEPGERVRVTVTTDADVAQPGDYTAGIGIRTNTPQDLEPIDVTMHVTPPRTWGKLQGSVEGIQCDTSRTGLGGAVVDLTPNRGDDPGYSLITEDDGSYAYWVITGRYQAIVAKDGYRPTVDDVRVPRGRIVTEDYALRRIGC